MRFLVLSRLRRQMVGSVAVATIAGLLAGCSGDVVRFDDGFYTGSIPQSVPAQTNAPAQPYPGAVDSMATGSIAPAQAPDSNSGGGFLATPQASQQSGYPAASASGPVMQRSQLPPPPPPVYRRAADPAPVTSSADVTAGSDPVGVPGDRPMVAAADSRASVPATRGAPPTSLQEQASRLATPSPRPVQQASRSTTVEASSQSGQPAGTVKVQSGDTISKIARKSGVSPDAIRRANGLTSDTIRIGQTLTIPSGGTVPAAAKTRVASLESTSTDTSSATKPAASAPKVEEPRQARVAEKSGRVASDAQVDPNPTGSVSKQVREEVAAVAPNSTGIDQFRWPVQGRVLKRFGEKVDGRRNDGLNISVPRGTPVKAAENGVVIYSGNGLKEFGNTILVKHDNGLVTVYGHADTLLVDKGATVRRGQEIAKSGMSGDTDVPILHFEVRKNSAPVDPTKYLQ
ncbi:peptidoglycan DD-metalloendopeptidase family protein [Jiella marina]|uniref:peptidoglycan DD-metalloendopeptidase family protein n=1 Tax=Jiella sp. LLJ827 TaxID=2917712 RepID=UPI002101CAE0|nr:peptidoglycan DD-metalloendopeptidase family protein [Jiella sp. LLJ827]MCQ0987457.1 peptidoglycan DD-metalloendopeptidase family protein [Jiella sp. LLJ827]